MPVLLNNLTAGYDRHPAVHHLSGQFADGTLTAIIGPNGGGKSTLLKAIAGLVRPMSGTVTLSGLSAKDIAYLPQLSEVDRDFPVSVMDVVVMGYWHAVGAWGAISSAQRQHAKEALAQVGMAAFAERPVSALSLGQWQRVLFARLAVQDARVLLLDEPFAAIDNRTTHDLVHILQHWQHEGRTVIAVMHDWPLVREHFQDALMLSRELIAWGSVQDVLRDVHFARAAELANSWSDHADECARMA